MLTRYEPWFSQYDGDWKDQQTGQTWLIESLGSKLKITDSTGYHQGLGQWKQLNDKWICPISFPASEQALTLEPINRYFTFQTVFFFYFYFDFKVDCPRLSRLLIPLKLSTDLGLFLTLSSETMAASQIHSS